MNDLPEVIGVSCIVTLSRYLIMTGDICATSSPRYKIYGEIYTSMEGHLVILPQDQELMAR